MSAKDPPLREAHGPPTKRQNNCCLSETKNYYVLTLSIPLSSLLDRAMQALPYHCRENSTVRCVVAPSQCRENSTEKSIAFERLYLFCLAPSVVRFYIDGLLVYQTLQWYVLYRGSPLWFSEKSMFEDFTPPFFLDKNHHHVSSLHEGFGLYVCL